MTVVRQPDVRPWSRSAGDASDREDGQTHQRRNNGKSPRVLPPLDKTLRANNLAELGPGGDEREAAQTGTARLSRIGTESSALHDQLAIGVFDAISQTALTPLSGCLTTRPRGHRYTYLQALILIIDPPLLSRHERHASASGLLSVHPNLLTEEWQKIQRPGWRRLRRSRPEQSDALARSNAPNLTKLLGEQNEAA